MASGGHTPVMLDEILETLVPRDGATYVDSTLGGGGYSRGLLEAAINQIRRVQTCVCVNVGRGTGLPATMFKPCLISEIGRSPSLLEANVNQLSCTCFCVNVGRGPGLPETMLEPCLITEIGRCPSPLEAIAHTRTHAHTHLHVHLNQHLHIHLHRHLHLYSHLHLHLHSGVSYHVDSVIRELGN